MAEVRNIPEARHYEITVDGEHAGLEAYVDSGNQRIFYHTEIDDQFGGRGAEAAIIAQQLDLALARADVPIVASCACRLDVRG